MLASTRSNGPHLRKVRRGEAGGADHPHMMTGFVQGRVLGRDPHRGRVDVGGQHRAMQRLGRRDPQHAGSGAEVEHALRPRVFQDMVKQK